MSPKKKNRALLFSPTSLIVAKKQLPDGARHTFIIYFLYVVRTYCTADTVRMPPRLSGIKEAFQVLSVFPRGSLFSKKVSKKIVAIVHRIKKDLNTMSVELRKIVLKDHVITM